MGFFVIGKIFSLGKTMAPADFEPFNDRNIYEFMNKQNIDEKI